MRIAFVAPAPWETISGGYLYDRAIVAELRDAGHHVDVVALAGQHPLPDDRAKAAAAAAWDAAETGDPPGETTLLIDGLGLAAFQPLADAFATRRVVGLIHHPTALETGRDPVSRERLRAIECDLLPRLTRIIVTSDDTAQRLATQFGVVAERIAVVVPATPAAPRSPGPARDGCDILSVATLLPRKGHDVLLRALARLGDLDWTLTIAGGAPDAAYAEELRALAQQLQIADRVRFAGEIAPADLAPYWEKAGMFALATHYEGYGMAIAEALRRGLPVAVTAGGAAAALVAPACGVVCDPGDHEQLSKAMRRIIYDRSLRLAMAEAACAAGAALPDWDEQARRFAAALAAA